MRKINLNMRWPVVLVVAFCMLFAVATAQAALTQVGPTLPLPTQYPTWYQDSLGVSLGPCWDYNGFCSLLPPFCPPSLGLGCLGTPINFDPAIPINSNNFPIETFYFNATTTMNIGSAVPPAKPGKFVQVIALEGSFGGLPAVPAAGTQTTFLRINARATGTLTPLSTFTVVHPFGTYTFKTDAAGLPIKAGGFGVFRVVDGCAAAPCDFTILLPAPTTNIGPWLVDAAGFHTDPATGNVYIGPGPLGAVNVVNGPNGNVVTITGPNVGGVGINTTTSSVFFLSGKVVGVTAAPQSVTFPVQQAVITSPTATVSLSNPDLVNAAALGQFTITGANAVDFAIVNNTCTPGKNLAAGVIGGCTFGVTFTEPINTPAANGPKSAVLSFPNTLPAFRPPTVINLSGVIDSIPPTVAATIPANNAVNFPANNTITATFSEPVIGVSSTTFTLIGPLVKSGPVTTVNGVVVMDPANKVATFTPNPPGLASDQTYTATISGVVTDLVNNAMGTNHVFSFATTNPDTTPPAAISSDPAADSTGAKVTDPITVTFNEAVQVNPLSINATTFFLDSAVTGSITWDPVARTASFTPDKPLEFFHKYTATVTTGVKSLGGVSMTANYTFSFLTNGAPDAPDLFSPEDGAVGVALPVQFQWVKSRDADGEAVTYHLWYCTNPGFLGCNPVEVAAATTTAGSPLHNTLAGLGGYGAGILLAGFAIVGGVRSRRKIFFFIAVLAISVMAAAACGKKTETVGVPIGVDPASVITHSASDLNPGSTYYWKVVADDGNGALIPSETRTFTTL